MIGGEATINDLRRRIAEIEKKRDVLAAHVERLREDVYNQALTILSDFGVRETIDDYLPDSYKETPTTSLARRDLLKQAEVLERAINVMKQPMMDGGYPWLIRVEDIQAMADELRKQAKEID